MALTVEDGTVVASADSYISQADADTYFTNHDDPSDWTGATSALKDSALRFAVMTMDGMFEWSGAVQSSTQVLGWPRTSAEDAEGRAIASSTIPQRIKDAQCELAVQHIGSPINAALDRGGDVRRERAGPVEVEYSEGAAAEQVKPLIERILLGLGKRRGAFSGEIERA